MDLLGLLGVIFFNLALQKLVIKNQRLKQRLGVTCAVCFLYIAYLYTDFLSNKDPNAYEKLNLPRYLSTQELKAHYREFARNTHPDKNPQTQDLFVANQKNFNYLKSEPNRVAYELYGEAQEEQRYIDVFSSFSFYMSWILLANGYSYSRENGYLGRYIMYSVSLLAFAEYQAKVRHYFLWLGFISLTVSEQLSAVKAVFPGIVLLIVSLKNYLKTVENERKLKLFAELNSKEQFKLCLKKVFETAESQEGSDLDTFIKSAISKLAQNTSSLGSILRLFLMVALSKIAYNFFVSILQLSA